MAQTLREKLGEVSKNQKYSSSPLANAMGRGSDDIFLRKINISTLTSDVSGALSATGDVIGTWHDASSINATKDQVNSLLKRLNLAETYFSGDEFKDNKDAQGMLEYVKNAKKTLSGDITSSLDSAIEYYGKFANADEYNSALAYEEAKKQSLAPFANLTSKEISSLAAKIESDYEQANKRPSFWGSVTEASKGSHAALDPFRALDQGEGVLRQEQIAAFNEKYKDYGITYESYDPELIKNLDELKMSRMLEEYTKDAATKVDASKINREAVIERLKAFERKYNGGVARSYDNLTNEQLAAYKYYSDLTMPSVELPSGKAEKIDEEEIKEKAKAAQQAGWTADWYASALLRYNAEQNTEKFLEDARKLGSENGFLGMYGAEWLGGAASLVGNVGTTIESAASYILNGKIKKDGNFSGLADVGDALREGATSYKTSWIKNENARKTVEYLNNIGYSIADNLAVMAISYAIGNYAGGTTQAISNISLAIMGTSAAGATIRESLAKGASDEEALALGAISGALEIVTEKIPLENLIKLGEEGAKQAVIKELLKQAGTEAAEESISEIGNIIADVVVLAEKSDYAKRLEELKASGEKNPDLKLFGELALQVVQSAGAGAISGAVLGTGALGVNKVRNTSAFIEAGRYYDAQKSAEAIVNAGLTYGEDTEIHKLAKSIKINSDGHTSNHRALGKLYYLMTDGVKDSLVAELRSSIADKVKNKSAQNALIKLLSGETPTKLEKRALAKDSAAQEVLRNSSAARDISEEWFPIVKNTVYALENGTLLIERGEDGYTVTFTPKGTEDVRTAEKQSIEKVSRIINEFREGKMPEFNTVDVGSALDSFEESVKAYESRQNKKTPDESKKYHVPEYVKSVARYLITTHGGDLRIEFSNKRSDGKTGFWRKNADGTRTVTIAANAKGINGVLIHELLHDLSGTASGKKLISELAEKAKTVLPGEEKSQYDKIKDLYAEKGINEDIDEEVAAAYLQAEFGKGDRMLHLVQSLGANSAKEMNRALESYSRATEKAIKDGELSGAGAAPLRAAALAVARHARLYNEALAQSATMAAVQRNTRSDRTASDNKKSASDNTETGKVKEKAAYAGVKAKGADLLKLETAVEMLENGADSETVRKETGWFKGYDGKWRFEIDDSKMKFSRNGFNPDYLRYKELELKFITGEISESELEELKNTPVDIKKITFHRLDQFVRHSDLFSAYPELKAIEITFDPDIKENGHFSPDKFSITLNPKNKDIKSTIIHEIQHAIQFIEEFSEGSSPEQWEKMRKDAVELVAGARHNLDLWLADIGFSEFSKKSLERVVAKEITLAKHWENLEKFKKKSKYAEQIAQSEAEVKKYEKELAKVSTLGDGSWATPKEMYFATAGEVEARDVAKRLDLTAEERKNTRPDIDREDVVFAEGKVIYYSSNSNESDSVKEQLEKHSKELSEMDVVETINYNVTTRGKARSDAGEIFKSLGNKIDRQGFGVIEIGEKQLSESAKYLNTPAEFAAWMTIPKVLKRGIIISGHNDHKSRGFSSVTIAAPVIINGKRGNVAAVVQQKGKNKYHVHRILMPDNSTFVYENIQQNAEPTFDSIAKEDSRKRLSISSASKNSIHQTDPVVNTSNKKSEKYSLADDKSSSDIVKAVLFSDSDVAQSKAKAHLTKDRVYNKTELLKAIKEDAADRLSELVGFEVRNVTYDYEMLESVLRGLTVQLNKGADEALIRELSDKAAEIITDGVVSVQDQSIVDEVGEEKVDAAYAAYNKIKSYIRRIEMSPKFKETLSATYGERTADYLINRWAKKEGSNKTFSSTGSENIADFIVKRWAKKTVSSSKTLTTVLEELAKNGINITLGENDAETLYNLNREMKAAGDTAFSANKKLSETKFGATERTKLIKSLSQAIYSVAKEGGEPGKLALRYSALKAHSEVIKIKAILNRHRETGKLGSPEYNAVLKAARTLSRGISKNGMKADAVNELLSKFTTFLEIHAPKLTDLVKEELNNSDKIETAAKEYNNAKNGEDTENSDLYKHVPYDLAKKLFLLKEMVADPNAALEPQHYEALAELLKTMRRLDSFYAKVYRDGHWIEAAPIAEKTARNLTVRIKALGNKGKGKKGETILPSDVTNLDTGEKAISKKLDAQKFIYNSLSPEVVAAMVAGFDEDSEIYKLIREIQDAAVEAQYLENEFKRSFEKFFKENKGYEERYQTHRIKYTFERAMPTGDIRKYHVTMTLGEAMYMYALAKRPHAETSLAIAQFDFIPRDGYVTDKRTHIPAVYFSGDYTSEEYEEQIRKMADFFKRSINKMAEENFNALDREFIKVFEEFFNKTASEAKSNADLERYGYTNVGESYYIPMVRSANGRDVNLLGLDYTLDAFSGVRNFSFNKRTVERARAPVAVQEVWELVQSHAHNLANYVALNDSLENLQRIYNAKISVGEGEFSELTSLRAVIEKQSWDGFTDYLRTYIKDVQGTAEIPAQDKLYMKYLRAIKSRYAVSVLALNIASYAKQGSSVLTMANQVSREAWWHGLEQVKNEDKIDVYSHGAAVRHNLVDQYRASSGMDKIAKRGEKLMFLLEKGDRSAIKRMWNMCQYEVYKSTGHMIGSEENLVAAGKMLDDMIIRVQDTSSASTKSAHARSKQELMSLTTMFRSADIKLTSNIYYSFAKVNALRRMSQNDPSLVSASDVKAQIKIAAQYGAVWLLTQTYVIAIDIIRSRIRGNKKERPIGEGEMNVFDEYFFNLLTGMAGQIPVVGAALEEILEKLINGYDSTNLYAQTLSSVADIISGSKSLIESASDGELTSGQIMKQLRNTAFTFGQLTGLPVRNVYNIIRSSIHMFPSATYIFDNFFGLNASTYSADLKSAIEGDNERLASTVISAISKDRTGEGVGKDTAEELVSLYSKGHTNILPSSFGKSVSITVNGESQDVDLSAKQRKALESEYGKSTNAVSKLVSSAQYKSLTSDERAAAVKSLYSIYRQRALNKVLGSDRTKQDVLASLMDESKLVCALSHIKTLKNDKKGNARSRVNAYLRTLGLTSEERNIVLYSAGYRDEDINASVTRSLRRLSLKSKELSAAKELLGL